VAEWEQVARDAEFLAAIEGGSDAGLGFETRIVVKTDALERLRRCLVVAAECWRRRRLPIDAARLTVVVGKLVCGFVVYAFNSWVVV
jgi:hypothetical protein